MEPSEKRDIKLYLDDDSILSIQAEAARFHLSISAYLRVWGKLLRDRTIIPYDTPIQDAFDLVRERISKFILEEKGRV